MLKFCGGNGVDGWTVADVAREADLTRQHIYQWRQEMRRKGFWPYGSIISVYTGSDEAITALTDDGIDELTDVLRDARHTTETWHQFLDDFVTDPELVQCLKAQPPR
ncbi:helix-turn-helix domain-containing protein [Paracoccus benzoatiresistens]|uniref:Helix-turn-helix domain-containing protein n=1 Tax=Paracoccus benzoatiresistens TaxID=2997341 RepID=A0ABT4JB19_9RHOB|nr:helix-turn-helix domain-containing protein [Paracoccus sp. EF6]MCZ0964089.1 helix-turn-helix domain-containing protein [Paracoccus sp. EF6]